MRELHPFRTARSRVGAGGRRPVAADPHRVAVLVEALRRCGAARVPASVDDVEPWRAAASAASSSLGCTVTSGVDITDGSPGVWALATAPRAQARSWAPTSWRAPRTASFPK